MVGGPAEGEIFSRNYLRPQVKQPDSARARRRCHRAFLDLDDGRQAAFVDVVQRSLGVQYPQNYGYSHEKYWTTCSVGDFLSSITFVFRLMQGTNPQAAYLREVRAIFADEALHYRIDDAGGVHYLADGAFAEGVEAAIAGLAAARFAAARQALEAGLTGLATTNPSGKTLIRGVFEAAESAFLVIVGDAKLDRISDKGIDDHLKPRVLAAYADVPNANDKVERTLETLKKWVRSAHPYRHGAPFDQVHEAPLEEAILSASIGMSFIRYMVQLP